MHIGRREVVAGALALVLSGPDRLAAQGSLPPLAAPTVTLSARQMYGLIGKMTAVPGQRDALIAILLESIAGMPGCLSYVVAKESGDPDAIWITEVWESEASHTASLFLPSVRQAIAKARPLIAGFSNRTVTTPIGGNGLVAPPAR